MIRQKMSLQSFILLSCISAVLSCQGGSILNQGVTEEDKRQILKTHNNLRALVAKGKQPGQPGAENMKEMVWDEELAARAQEWSNQCVFKHDPRRVVDRFTMGQNIAIIWSTAPIEDDEGDFPSRIQKWFNEVQTYAFGAPWSSQTGHYSQLVWSETNLVGCGFTHYKTADKYNKIFVCNYGPGGNVEGSLPYVVGSPSCLSHGMTASSHYPGLCASSAVTSSVDNRLIETVGSASKFNQYSGFVNHFSFTKSTLQKETNIPEKSGHHFNVFFNRVQSSVHHRTQNFRTIKTQTTTTHFNPYSFINRVRRSLSNAMGQQNQKLQNVQNQEPEFSILRRK